MVYCTFTYLIVIGLFNVISAQASLIRMLPDGRLPHGGLVQGPIFNKNKKEEKVNFQNGFAYRVGQAGPRQAHMGTIWVCMGPQGNNLGAYVSIWG